MQETEFDPLSLWSGFFSPWKSRSAIGSNRNVYLVNASHTGGMVECFEHVQEEETA